MSDTKAAIPESFGNARDSVRGFVRVFGAALMLLGCATGATDLLDGPETFGEPGLIHVVVEIPAGTNDKWEVDGESGLLHWELKDGKPRVVQYLAYPGNYGMIPRTRLPAELGGDGDPLDVLLLGPALERGAVVTARPIGVLKLLDDGERDDKVLAVPLAGPLSDVTDLASLDAGYPGARAIVETWFTHYKGPGRVEANGTGGADEALAIVEEAAGYYAGARR
jgi:inorganic pyrophosphatase